MNKLGGELNVTIDGSVPSRIENLGKYILRSASVIRTPGGEGQRFLIFPLILCLLPAPRLFLSYYWLNRQFTKSHAGCSLLMVPRDGGGGTGMGTGLW